MFKKILISVLAAILLVACSAKPTPDPRIDQLIGAVSGGQTQEALNAADTQGRLQSLSAGQDGLQAQVNDLATQNAATPVIIINTAVPAELAQGQASPDLNSWKITWLPAADKVLANGKSFKQSTENWDWRQIDPSLWPDFPNVPNPLVPDFRVVKCADDPTKDCVPDGMEYAMNESNFCQQLAGEACKYPVGAGHYLFYSGDYSQVPELGSCKGTEKYGCEMAIANVGDVSSDYTSVFQQGFRLHARFFNGDTLNMGLWALMSNGASNMMNLSSNLNPAGFTNGGANCSVKTGCPGVNARILITSGNEPLLMLTTQVTRP